MTTIRPLDALDPARFDSPAILKRLASSRRKLAEVEGMAASIPRHGVLINALSLALGMARTEERLDV